MLDWYDAHPDARAARVGKRNEALGFIRQGLQDFSISRTSLNWGIPIPWDDRHVTYVWYDALDQLHRPRSATATTKRGSRRGGRGHHLIGKDILRFHCVYWPAMLLAAGLEPPASIHVHGFLLVGGEKMSKTKLNQIAPADLVADFGVDGFRYHFLRDAPFGPDGDFSYEGMVARYNSDLANNLGNLLSRVAHGRRQASAAASGLRLGPTARSRRVAGRASTTHAAAAWDARAAVRWRSRPRGGSSARPTPTSRRTSRGRPSPAPRSTPCSATRSRCCASSPSWRSPAIPTRAEEIWRRIGLHGSVARPAAARAAARGAAIPGGLPVEKGAPLFPRIAVAGIVVT